MSKRGARRTRWLVARNGERRKESKKKEVKDRRRYHERTSPKKVTSENLLMEVGGSLNLGKDEEKKRREARRSSRRERSPREAQSLKRETTCEKNAKRKSERSCWTYKAGKEGLGKERDIKRLAPGKE